jgi:hypothetical protein
VTNGYVGLGPFYPKLKEGALEISKSQISAKLRIVWDIIADLKRVKVGDLCFLHSENLIYGPFIFKSIFYESNDLPELLRSSSLLNQIWFDNRNDFSELEFDEYGYVAAIDQPTNCNLVGTDIMELFLRQASGSFNGIPPRFMYGDTKKIVKPILNHEIPQLLEILGYSDNFQIEIPSAYPILGLNNIDLNLNNYNGALNYEKILEAWFMRELTLGNNNNIVEIFGNCNYYANSIFTYYTNVLDVILYNVVDNYTLKFCEHCNNIIHDSANNIRIIELKRDFINDGLNVITQIKGYMKWAKRILSHNTDINGYIVAKGFSHDYIDFVIDNPMANIKLVQYDITDTGILLIQI